jgi:hypothetical protein
VQRSGSTCGRRRVSGGKDHGPPGYLAPWLWLVEVVLIYFDGTSRVVLGGSQAVAVAVAVVVVVMELQALMRSHRQACRARQQSCRTGWRPWNRLRAEREQSVSRETERTRTSCAIDGRAAAARRRALCLGPCP